MCVVLDKNYQALLDSLVRVGGTRGLFTAHDKYYHYERHYKELYQQTISQAKKGHSGNYNEMFWSLNLIQAHPEGRQYTLSFFFSRLNGMRGTKEQVKYLGFQEKEHQPTCASSVEILLRVLTTWTSISTSPSTTRRRYLSTMRSL